MEISNELIFIIAMVVDLSLVLAATRFGKQWLKMLIVLNLIMVQFTAVKNHSLFGFVANGSAVFYAAIFLATDILSEHWGKKAGYSSVLNGLLAVVFLIVFGNLYTLISPVEANAATDAFNTLFKSAPRITAASLIAYLIAQNLDVWLYDKIDSWMGGKHLWMRNNGSTLISQFLDSVIFFGIAFGGVVPNIWSLILTGYVAKLIVALFDTPFLYLSHKLLGTK
jgi:uncharacterized integral membrane protein (TIGR00697 family)